MDTTSMEMTKKDIPLRESTMDRLKRIENKYNNLSSEKISDKVTRNVGQNVARGMETILGFPGNLKKSYLQSRDILENMFKDYLIPKSEYEAPQENKFPDFPTSLDIREKITPQIAEYLTKDKEYFEPKNKLEEKAGELTQDFTSFFLPGTGQLRMMTRIGAPILGNIMKSGAEYLGAGKENAEKAKLGTMLAFTLASQSNPREFSSGRIQQAKNMIPETTTIDALPLAKSLSPLVQRLQKGLSVPSKSKTFQGIQDLSSQVQNGRISLRSLMEARDNINEWISEAGGWEVPTPVRDASIRNLNELKTQVIRSINRNMERRFPEAADLYKTGYEAAAVTHRSNAISNFIGKHFGKHVQSASAKILFPSLIGAPIFPKTAAVGGALYPAYKIGQVLYRVGRSPTLAKYYSNIIAEAALGNAPSMIKNMDKLDKELLKDEKKNNNDKNMTLDEFKKSFRKRD